VDLLEHQIAKYKDTYCLFRSTRLQVSLLELVRVRVNVREGL